MFCRVFGKNDKHNTLIINNKSKSNLSLTALWLLGMLFPGQLLSQFNNEKRAKSLFYPLLHALLKPAGILAPSLREFFPKSHPIAFPEVPTSKYWACTPLKSRCCLP